MNNNSRQFNNSIIEMKKKRRENIKNENVEYKIQGKSLNKYINRFMSYIFYGYYTHLKIDYKYYKRLVLFSCLDNHTRDLMSSYISLLWRSLYDITFNNKPIHISIYIYNKIDLLCTYIYYIGELHTLFYI